MGGWFVDILVEYLFRVIVRAVRLLRSRDWPVAMGIVLSAECPRSWYGCTVASVYYEYPIAGEKYGAVYEKPFLSHDSGVEYAAQFVKGIDFKVRVKPEDPSTSVPSD
jgi:hypothetical protein